MTLFTKFLVRLTKQRYHRHTTGSNEAYIQMGNLVNNSCKYARKALTNVGPKGEPIPTPIICW